MTEPAALTCRELVELVTEYLDGAMDEDGRERFEAHLALCPGGETYVQQIHQTIREVGKVEEEHLSTDARHRLLAAFRDWKA